MAAQANQENQPAKAAKAGSAKGAKGAGKSGGASKPVQAAAKAGQEKAAKQTKETEAAAPERFSDWLVCPQCKGELDESPQRLRCEKCGIDYPIEDGIPVMLPPSPPEAPEPAQEGAGG